ncbi:MAG TPA: ATP--guanido phosphotransferase [Candidatus Limiplasma sp.]|nr:ATP--guanido phosphotransferase [Candidatus Limiplasma sp.]HPS80845.1 ATP--guanido phosphotransferase [Candidatus Limiplasma sp.]
MSENFGGIVVSSRVRLARNYYDLPFSNVGNPDNAQRCIDRATKAMESETPNGRFSLYLLKNMNKIDQLSLMEQHLVSRDLLLHSDVGAALVRADRHISVMVNEEDHLRIQAMLDGFSLSDAASLAFDAEDRLASVCDFSFDNQLGYLTACPTNTGTGMRASLMLHLPMLTRCKQMGNVSQTVAKLGLTIRGIYGEGSEALGDLYQVSNQVTLGRTEGEIIEAVSAVGRQLIDMENVLRVRSDKENLDLQDSVWRSYGALRFAKQMETGEFMEHWSNLRLGAAMAILPVPLTTVDELLTVAQDAHAKKFKHSDASLISTNQARCVIIQAKLAAKED